MHFWDWHIAAICEYQTVTIMVDRDTGLCALDSSEHADRNRKSTSQGEQQRIEQPNQAL